MPFQDGHPPPTEIISQWLRLCNERFRTGKENCIAVHCVAGLGRAPVLVAIALIEDNVAPAEAVKTIREKR